MFAGRISTGRASAIILAGGASSRMGCDKAGIELYGKTLLQIAHDELERYFNRIVISIRPGQRKRYEQLGLKLAVFVEDELFGRGPLGGIYSVMNAVESRMYFAVACDMPFLSGRLAAGMIAAAGDYYDVVIPRTGDGHLHPLHAVYRRTCLPHIRRQLEIEKNNKIIDFFDKVKVLFFDENIMREFGTDPRCLSNINTRGDLERILIR